MDDSETKKPHRAIVQLEAPVLRAISDEVPKEEISSVRIQSIIATMKLALAAEPDGAALAAPQIGEPYRIFVLQERVFGSSAEGRYASKDPHMVFINPEIVKTSVKRKLMDEGCLSVRGVYGTIERCERATVRALDEHGQLFTRGASGLLAQVFQHECDHLNGILFIDHAQETWNVDGKSA